MPDETLIGAEIIELGNKLFDDFNPALVKGTSYDIRVGSAARIPATDGSSEYLSIALGKNPAQPKISIPPGAACIIQSLEKIHMPNNIKGRLALRAFHARRLVFFPGGIIDPGYDDFLFIPIINMGDVPLVLNYGEPIVNAEFVKLGRDTQPYKSGAEPPSAFAPSAIVFDKVALIQKIKKQEEAIEELRETVKSGEIMISSSQRIMDFIVLAVVGGGMVALGVNLFPKLEFPWNAVALGGGLVVGTIMVGIIFMAIPRRK